MSNKNFRTTTKEQCEIPQFRRTDYIYLLFLEDKQHSVQGKLKFGFLGIFSTFILIVAQWCDGYHCYTNLFNKIETQVCADLNPSCIVPEVSNSDSIWQQYQQDITLYGLSSGNHFIKTIHHHHDHDHHSHLLYQVTYGSLCESFSQQLYQLQ